MITKTAPHARHDRSLARDYPGTCAPMTPATIETSSRPSRACGRPLDADIVAEAPGGVVSVALGKDCGVLSSEIACGPGVMEEAGNRSRTFACVARDRQLPDLRVDRS